MRTLYNIVTEAQVLYIKISGAINTDIKAAIGISKTYIKKTLLK